MYVCTSFNMSFRRGYTKELKSINNVDNLFKRISLYGDEVKGPRDYEVDPVLWEIRRERRIELAFENLRFDDLRRWAKGHYTDKVMYGAYIRKADYENTRHVKTVDMSKFDLKIEDKTKDTGRICLFGKPTPGWTNKYYLYPIPINDLKLNAHLQQNPGYLSGK